jgi:hypothetical protein
MNFKPLRARLRSSIVEVGAWLQRLPGSGQETAGGFRDVSDVPLTAGARHRFRTEVVETSARETDSTGRRLPEFQVRERDELEKRNDETTAR